MKKYILIISVAYLLCFSCDDFINVPKPTASISSGDAFGTQDGVETVFTGIYRRIREYNDGAGDDSEAIGSILNTWNVKGNDFIRPQFNWFVFEYRYLDVLSSTGRKTNLIWNEMYEIINTANIVISEIAASSFSNTLKVAYTAEARAIRGMAYHHLIREYAIAYALGTNNPGVPIYIEPSTGKNANQGNARASVGEVYDQIRSDLEFAVTNLTTNRRAKWAINQNVANGLLARVYLYMGLYSEAVQAARSARMGFALNAAEYTMGFQDISSMEWMWGAPQQNDQTLFFGSFASFWDASRYARIFANPSFVANFTSTDVRNTFSLQGTGPYPTLYKTSKFVAAADFGEDLVLMRVSEMYLIEMESLARQGGANETLAATLLFSLQSNRDNAFTSPSGNTGTALINEIMLERRKELYGEKGVDYIDARRLGVGFTRDNNHELSYRFEFISGDTRFNYPIPQAEIDSNPNISLSDQNP